jgi:hypothetical protein
LQGRVLLGLELYGVYLPLSLVDMLHATGESFDTYWFHYPQRRVLLDLEFYGVYLPFL